MLQNINIVQISYSFVLFFLLTEKIISDIEITPMKTFEKISNERNFAEKRKYDNLISFLEFFFPLTA